MSSARLVRAFWPALTAGVIWAASGSANWFVSRYLETTPHEVVNLVLPPTFTWSSRFAQAGVPISVLSTFFVTLAVWAASLALLRHFEGKQHRAALFLATWLITVLAAIVTIALQAVAAYLQAVALGPVPGVRPEDSLQIIEQGGYWGIVTGWLPALVALLVSRSRSAEAGTRARRPKAALIVLAAAAVACGIATGITSYSATSVAWAQAHPPVTIVTGPAPTHTPLRPATPLPTPVADASRCGLSQAAITVGGESGALGHRAITINLRNSGTTTCDAFGYADLRFYDTTGHLLDIAVSSGSSYLAQDPGAQKIPLAPGQDVVAILSWTPTVSDNAPGTVGSISIAPAAIPANSPGITIPLHLDLTDADPATLTAWQLSP